MSSELLNSYEFGHVVISIICICILLQAWKYYYNMYSGTIPVKKMDWALLYLSAGLAIWAGIKAMKMSGADDNNEFVSLLSIFNNMCFTLSFGFFEHGIIKKHLNVKDWQIGALIFGLILALTSIICTYFQFKIVVDKIELYYSLATLGGFLILLVQTFLGRKLPFIAFLSCIVIIYLILSQSNFNKEISQSHNIFNDTLLLSSYACFCCLIVALSFSWIKSVTVKKRYIEILGRTDFSENDKFQEDINNRNISDSQMFERVKQQLSEQNYAFLAEEIKTYCDVKGIDSTHINWLHFQLENFKQMIRLKLYKGDESKIKEAKEFHKNYVETINKLNFLSKELLYKIPSEWIDLSDEKKKSI